MAPALSPIYNPLKAYQLITLTQTSCYRVIAILNRDAEASYKYSD